MLLKIKNILEMFIMNKRFGFDPNDYSEGSLRYIASHKDSPDCIGYTGK